MKSVQSRDKTQHGILQCSARRWTNEIRTEEKNGKQQRIF